MGTRLGACLHLPAITHPPPCLSVGADFGLSKVLSGTTTSSVANSSIATNPVWQPPEVMQGERPTAAGDVYSYGLGERTQEGGDRVKSTGGDSNNRPFSSCAAVLYELLTWKLPWGVGEDCMPFQVRRSLGSCVSSAPCFATCLCKQLLTMLRSAPGQTVADYLQGYAGRAA